MINYNGKLVENTENGISFLNRGLNYGDALFETIKVSNRKINFLEDHYFRLMASMRILRMEIPMNFTMEFMEEEVLKTINTFDSSNTNFRVKMVVSRKPGGKYTPTSNDIDYFVIAELLENDTYTISDKTYTIELFKDYYVASGLLSTLKTTSKTIQILGSIYAKENDYDNCILLNEKKQVVEALNGNLFLVKENDLITPPLSDGCLKGILRQQLVTICKKSAQFNLLEKSISPFDFQKADELFITNVIQGIQPITHYRKKVYNTRVAQILLEKLNELV